MKSECFKLFDGVYLYVKDIKFYIYISFRVSDLRYNSHSYYMTTDQTFMLINYIREMFNDLAKKKEIRPLGISDGITVNYRNHKLSISKYFTAGRYNEMCYFHAGESISIDDAKNFNSQVKKAINLYTQNLKEYGKNLS